MYIKKLTKIMKGKMKYPLGEERKYPSSYEEISCFRFQAFTVADIETPNLPCLWENNTPSYTNGKLLSYFSYSRMVFKGVSLRYLWEYNTPWYEGNNGVILGPQRDKTKPSDEGQQIISRGVLYS